MVISKVPDALKDLTQVEEILVSWDFPVMQIYRKPNGGCKGHVISPSLGRGLTMFKNLLIYCPVILKIFR